MHLERFPKSGRIGDCRTSQDHLDYGIIEVSQNTKKSPGDLKRFAKTSVKYHQLTQVGKNR